MFPYALALLIAIQAPQAPKQDDVKETLARAESLYFEAKFTDAIKLLSELNDSLQTRPDRMQDKISAKLQLALAHIGMNNAPVAKLFLIEIYLLNPDFNLDAQQYSPKVLALANEARAEQGKIRCVRAGEEARKNLAEGEGAALVNLLRTMKPKCPELAAVEPEGAELLYKKGLQEYKDGDYGIALEKFRTAVKLSPKHELAAQYVDLAETKLQLAEDRMVLEWQRNFDARKFSEAAANYRQIASFSSDEHSQTVNRVSEEYRKALRSLAETWTQACAKGDGARMTEVRNQAKELVPEASFGDDLRSKMESCSTPLVPETKVAATSGESSSSQQGCFQMEYRVALARLKTRVEPEFPREARIFFQNQQIVIHVKTMIDERGNAFVTDITGSNGVVHNSVRAAVEKWKFVPALDQNGPRCVVTDIPLTLGK